ncbi:MAG: RNA polymerase sigma-54 factor, partial [Pseudomonadota bacterium]
MSSVGQRLELRLGTSLVMTPQLQQAIKLLQLSAIELQDYVDQELEGNPLLERAELGTGDDAPVTEEAQTALDAVAVNGDSTTEKPADREATSELTADIAPEGAAEVSQEVAAETPTETPDLTEQSASSETFDAAFDDEYDNVWTNADAEMPTPSMPSWEQAGSGGGAGAQRFDEDDEALEQRYSRPPDLREYLNEQIPLELPDPQSRMVALALLDNLNEAGYLDIDCHEMAEQLGCPEAQVEQVLSLLQGLDPPGIFARNLPECLKLQLEDRNRFDPAMATLLDNLDLLAAREFGKLRKLCAVDDEDLSEMIGEIRALDPKPAASFDIPPAAPVIPDIFVRPNPRGEWLVELNPDALPKVLVNQAYHAEVSAKLTQKADKEYVSEQFQSANWLVK